MFKAVRSVTDFRSLDEAEILIGYMDGMAGLVGEKDMTMSYWHGWRNGAVDAGFIEPDQAQLQLEQEFAKLAEF
ncbi:hypothetical protein D9599_19610 [Roseomonas sp. KE2513]|uniref:hypothetical protein n=1 Tax=Roseomonas sp. KE2513 TaxID=2479202 RepID=UPI0018DFBC96|nr:hypothetical protein [Roseomonas sp. KE2513]MBI0537769.1 hypothetical protein [Roseomonas sp. KE2513]